MSDESNEIPIEAEGQAIASPYRRSPLAVSVAVVLLCAACVPAPFFLRTGDFGIADAGANVVIAHGQFGVFAISVVVIAIASFLRVYGRRVSPFIFLLAGALPVGVASITTYVTSIAPIPLAAVRVDNEVYREAAILGPYLLSEGAACSASLFMLVAALGFALPLAVTVPRLATAWFHFATFVLSLPTVGGAIFMYTPGKRIDDDLAFSEQLKLTICVFAAVTAIAAPFAAARLNRYKFLEPLEEDRRRGEAWLAPLGCAGFSLMAVLLGVEECRWRALMRWKLYSQHFIGNEPWERDALFLVVLSLVATASGFFVVRRTSRSAKRRSLGFWVCFAALVAVIGFTIGVDAEIGKRELRGVLIPQQAVR